MSNFNRVILVGNLTRDPQLSFTPSNTPVCEFGLAVNRRYRDRDGNQKEETCFVDLNAYGRQGETINQYMRKGRAILIEGRLRHRQWTSKEGQNRSKLDVIVENFTFLGGGGGGGASGGGRAEGGRGRTDDDAPPPMDDEPTGGDSEIPF
jgi:single-strand DNA-binding protein